MVRSKPLCDPTSICYLSDKTNYDKSSLAQKWRDLSSKENMELDDDDYYYYSDYDDDDDRRKRKKKNHPENSSTKISVHVLNILTISCLIFFLSS